jgi:cell division protein FtsN
VGEDSRWLASMISPTLNPERRQAPRTTVNRLAYINFDSNNGAILLNVSAAGLCFHSVAPVQKSETIRFWFSEDNHRIEVDGQLAWIDEKQKTGGLRFTNLSNEARVQVRDWMSEPAMPATAGARLAPSLSAPSALPTLSVRRPHKDAMHRSSARLEVPSPRTKGPVLLSGFSAGLVLGILVSAVAAAVLLIHAYPREFGNSLIQLGERLRARSLAQKVSPISETLSAVPAPNPAHVKLPAQPQIGMVKPQQVKAVVPAPVAAPRAPTTAASTTAAAPAISSAPSTTSPPKTPVEPQASDISGTAVAVPGIESANHPDTHIEDSRAGESRAYSATYLEVGRFRDATWADRATGELEQLGFHTSVVHKGHLMMNSYQVLVGPYNSDEDAKAAHQELVSRGFRPRAYERGSRTFWFPAGLTFHGTHIPVDDCVVSWESYVTDAVVKFEKDGYVIATAEGKWVKRGARYESNAIVYQRNGDGSRTLLEIRFSGMSRALVFGEPS